MDAVHSTIVVGPSPPTGLPENQPLPHSSCLLRLVVLRYHLMAFFEHLAELVVAFSVNWEAGALIFALCSRWRKGPQSVGVLAILAIHFKFLWFRPFEDDPEDFYGFLVLAILLELKVPRSSSEAARSRSFQVTYHENLLLDLFGRFAQAYHGWLFLIRYI